MIIQLIMTLIGALLRTNFLSFNLPAVPDGVRTAFSSYFDYIFNNLDFLSFFVNVNTLKAAGTIIIVLFSFEHLYKIILWIIHKLPFSID